VLTFLKRKRVGKDNMYTSALISPAQAEKLFAGEKKILEQLEGLIERTGGKVTLAPESDRRPAVAVTTAADAFNQYFLK
jgi:hypothetical protein